MVAYSILFSFVPIMTKYFLTKNLNKSGSVYIVVSDGFESSKAAMDYYLHSYVKTDGYKVCVRSEMDMILSPSRKGKKI